MHLAAEHGELDCVQFLLRAGADPTKLSKQNKHALHVAAAQGRLDTVDYLIKVLVAVHSRNVYLLLCAQHLDGIDLNMVDEEKQTCLYLAAAAGHLPVVELLISHNVDEVLDCCFVDADLCGRIYNKLRAKLHCSLRQIMATQLWCIDCFQANLT